MTIEMPGDVKYIIHMLEQAGYEAYAVGGCVRDILLGRIPQDWDITTSALPQEIKALFPHTVDTGIQHGTVTVLCHRVGYEVTTYRIDGEYEDNRHPRSVEFTDNLQLDLERRDFTINAMAYNETRGLVDIFGGIEDIERGVIRCVGDAGDRFDEDALRMLRAVRFSGQLGFEIEEKTRRAIAERAGNLKDISAERIRTEITKLLVAKGAGQLRTAYHTGMTKVFLPEFDRMMEMDQKNHHHIYTVGEHAMRAVEVMNCFFGIASRNWSDGELPPEIREAGRAIADRLSAKQHVMLCVTMLLHDVAKPSTMTLDENGTGHFYGHPQKGEEIAGKILRRLTFDNDTVGTVKRLVRWHDYQFADDKRAVRRAGAKIGRDMMPLLFLVQFSDILSQNPETFAPKLKRVMTALSLWQQILEEKPALELKELAVTGSDIIELGVKPGPEIGRILKGLLELVIEEPDKNNREFLLNQVLKMSCQSADNAIKY